MFVYMYIYLSLSIYLFVARDTQYIYITYTIYTYYVYFLYTSFSTSIPMKKNLVSRWSGGVRQGLGWGRAAGGTQIPGPIYDPKAFQGSQTTKHPHGRVIIRSGKTEIPGPIYDPTVPGRTRGYTRGPQVSNLRNPIYKKSKT